MKFFLLLFVLITSSLFAQVLFRTTDPFEKDEIHNSMIAFVSQM